MRGIPKMIVERVVDDLLAAGYWLNVGYGDGEEMENYSRDREEVLDMVGACDEEILYTLRRGHGSWVMFIYENGAECLTDYGVSLDADLTPTLEWIDTLI